MNIRTVNFRKPDAGIEFVRSLHESGFAVLQNHPIPRELLESIYRDWHAFFSSDEINAYLYDPDNADHTQQGYHPAEVSETAVGHSVKDIKEFFHVVPSGKIPPSLAEPILRYRDLTMQLGRQLVGWIQEYAPDSIVSGFSEPLPESLCSTASLLRVLHYPPLTGTEEVSAIRAAAHEDINLITILPVADQPGLQVKDNSGEWIDVASIRGELVVNSGDMLREASVGYFPSTTHRVINPGDNIANEPRISVPFFLTPRLDMVLSKRYTSGSYLEERLRLLTR